MRNERVARQDRQRGGDVGERHVVLALVVLDERAEQLQVIGGERLCDRVVELRHALGVDVLDRGQLHLGERLTGSPLDRLEQVPLTRSDEQQASPVRPARPVRPMRCTYDSVSCGMS